MGSINGEEFDGDTVLCRVCGDKASGFHYGVHACEGCKGFFRRSIQQKIQYRPCLKNQQCNIMRVNRNRCQYCRLKKCISVGMSRDAVRFGRVPKKEKARIIEQMQKVNSQSQASALSSMLQNEQDVVQAVINAHQMTCDMSLARVSQMRGLALQLGNYINCPANMACPLNNHLAQDTNKNDLEEFSESFTPAIKSVVDFAKGIPGFTLLNQDDQVTLLKAGTFEVLLVRLACLFDPESNTMMFTGGRLFRRLPSSLSSGAGFLLDSMFDFAERFNKLCLCDEELALFAAVVLMSPDRPGLRNMEQVERIQNKLTQALQNIINLNHKEDSTLFAKLLMKTTDLRTLNTLHSEKSIGTSASRIERQEHLNTEESEMDFQDSMSAMSGRSSPTPSEMSNMTVTSGSFSDTCSLESGAMGVRPQRLPVEAAAHQQVVLRTPYGTFYREEMSGYYGLVADQPRRRCNTLDRDTLTRPRLHTIEEGNRRRYTLDREYINKMVNRLSDKLEKRTALRGDSVPPSLSSSAASSPIPEEYGGPGSFVPISVLEQAAGSTRVSPVMSPEALMAAQQAYLSSPNSPRPHSESFGIDDYQQRRRCYSFHLGSEGRAARAGASLHPKLLAERGTSERQSPESQHYLSSEHRRGSVGATSELHARKRSLLVDRHPSYLTGPGDSLRSGSVEKRMLTGLKHAIPESSIYGMPVAPPKAHSPNMIQRRIPLTAGSLGLSPPTHMLPRINPHAGDDSDIMPPPLGRLEEDIVISSAITAPSATVTSKDMVAMDTIAELRVPSTSSSRSSSRMGSPSHDSEPVCETFGHKKFDKFRKATLQVTVEDTEKGLGELSKGKKATEEAILMDFKEGQVYSSSYARGCLITPPAGGSNSGSDHSSCSSDNGKTGNKRSAKEAHPNLLAFLNSPSQNGGGATPPSTLPVSNTPSAQLPAYSWHSPYSKEIQNSSSVSSSEKLGVAFEINSKEQFHAATVSNLKEKLMRKFDSSENLHRASAGVSAGLVSESDSGHYNRPASSSSGSPLSTGAHTPPNSPSSASPLTVSDGMVPANLHSSTYHLLLNSHYPMQTGGRPTVVTPQHLAGLQQQFAQMLASSTSSGCPLHQDVSASPRRNDTELLPLNLTAAKVEADGEMTESVSGN